MTSRTMRSVIFAALAAMLALGPLAPSPAAAKSYRFSRISVDVTVQQDGTMRVREERTFDFDGSFRAAWIEIARGGAPQPGQDARALDYRVQNPGVSENGSAYRQTAPGDETPGTFWFDERAQGWIIEWNFRAQSERRTFVVTYEIAGHVVAYDDVAEVFWRFLGDDRGAPTDAFVARVLLPDGASEREVRAWGRGPLEGEVEIASAREVRWHAPRVRGDETVIGRVAFPSQVVPGAPRAPGERLPAILAEEQRLADEANAARARARRWNVGAGLAGFGSLTVFLLLFFRYGREHGVEHEARYLRELPHDYPPAIVGYLMRFGKIHPSDMVATLMDLARRGYLSISEVRASTRRLARKDGYEFTITVRRDDAGDLAPYEAEVLRILIEAGARDGLSARDLQEWAKKDPGRMQERYASFRSAVGDHARELDLIEVRGWAMGLNLLAVAGAVGVAVVTLGAQAGRDLVESLRNAPGAWFALAVAATQTALTPVLRQRTRHGAHHHAQWSAFRRFLRHFSRMGEYRPTAIAIWEQYLVYAIPLGAADAVTEAIKLRAPEEIRERGFSWYGFAPGQARALDGATFASSVGGITRSLTASAEAAFSTKPSSGGGGGGGFSGGGGGGSGGGGSSGAR